jgi:hypothetical protein
MSDLDLIYGIKPKTITASEMKEKKEGVHTRKEVKVQDIKLTPYGRTKALARRTPWSYHCIRDTPAWASCLYTPRGIWPHQWLHQ